MLKFPRLCKKEQAEVNFFFTLLDFGWIDCQGSCRQGERQEEEDSISKKIQEDL